MKEKIHAYEVRLVPKGALFFGGYSAAEGASGGDTAHDREGLVIPASAVKGALREMSLKVLRGATLHAAEAEAESAGGRPDYLSSLFGHELQENAGKIRVGPLRLGAREDRDVHELLSVRHHVSLRRETRSAAHGHLFEQRVVAAGLGLEFKGRIDLLDDLEPAEHDLLALSARLVDQLGAGRGRGLGQIELRLEPVYEPATSKAHGGESFSGELERLFAGAEVSARRHAVLELEVEEPLKLGVTKDTSNVEESGDVIRGSMLRGAVASALYRLPGMDDAQAVVDRVIGDTAGQAATDFGDGHAVHESKLPESTDRAAEDRQATVALPAPMTLRVPKDGSGGPTDSAVGLCLAKLAEHTAGKASRRAGQRNAKGSWAKNGDGAWKRVKIPRRLITRLARDAISGRAADGKLYSIEVVDPGDRDYQGTLRYQVPVFGTRQQLEWIVRAFGVKVWVGGTRTRGFGGVSLRRLLLPSLPDLSGRHARWVEALVRGGADREKAASTGAVLALGPIALHQERLELALEELGLELLGGSSRRQVMGGWNSREQLPRIARSCFVPGSVWLVTTRDGSPALPALSKLEEKGLGPGRPDGWGRVVACHDIHVDCAKRSEP